MGFKGFYKVLVVGGAAMGAGCGGSSDAVRAESQDVAQPAKTEAAQAPEKAESAQPAVVPAAPVGEAKTTAPVNATPAAAAPEGRTLEPAKVGDVDCEKVCSGTPDAETFCPDPAMDGASNCCWLMMKKHVCCPG